MSSPRSPAQRGVDQRYRSARAGDLSVYKFGAENPLLPLAPRPADGCLRKTPDCGQTAKSRTVFVFEMNRLAAPASTPAAWGGMAVGGEFFARAGDLGEQTHKARTFRQRQGFEERFFGPF